MEYNFETEEVKLLERDTVGGGLLVYGMGSMCIPGFVYSVTCIDINIHVYI